MQMDINTVPTCHYIYGVAPIYMSELISLHFMQQDTQRINKVANAIKFNNELLAELYHE